MSQLGQCNAGKAPKIGWISVFGGILLLWFLAAPAQAMVVEIDIGWGYGQNWAVGDAEDNLISNYNLQEGSIVQVIMFNSGTPGTDTVNYLTENPNYNFYLWGSYGGPDQSSEPYSGVDPGVDPTHVPDSRSVYFPDTTPAGHVIAATYQIGSAIDGGPGVGYWYNIFDQFTILGTWDHLYVRVFGATDFPQGEVIASYWGLSGVQSNAESIGIWYVPVGSLDDTVADQKNYFEVIPEPGSLALFLLGGAGLVAGHRRRRKSVRGG